MQIAAQGPAGKSQDPDSPGKRARFISVIQLRWKATTMNPTARPATLAGKTHARGIAARGSAIPPEGGSTSAYPAIRSSPFRRQTSGRSGRHLSSRLRQSGCKSMFGGRSALFGERSALPQKCTVNLRAACADLHSIEEISGASVTRSAPHERPYSACAAQRLFSPCEAIVPARDFRREHPVRAKKMVTPSGGQYSPQPREAFFE